MKSRLNWPPTEALDAVLAASKLGSFSAAAADLALTHGAISRRVATVERWAGFQLFDRHGRGVRLTPQGERLIFRVEQIFSVLEHGRQSVGEFSQVESVLVSVAPSFARLWLLPRLRGLEGQPQDLRVELEIDPRLAVLSDSRMAIRYGAGRWPGTVATPLFDEEFVPVAGSKLGCAGAMISPGELIKYPLIHDISEVAWREWFRSNGIAYGRREQDRAFSDYDTTLLAASQGLGVALLRAPYGVDQCDRLGLSIVSNHRMPNPLKYHVVAPLGQRSPGMQLLINRIVEAANG